MTNVDPTTRRRPRAVQLDLAFAHALPPIDNPRARAQRREAAAWLRCDRATAAVGRASRIALPCWGHPAAAAYRAAAEAVRTATDADAADCRLRALRRAAREVLVAWAEAEAWFRRRLRELNAP